MLDVNPPDADRESVALESITVVLLPGLDGTGKLFAGLLSELPPALSARIVEYPAQRFLSYRQLIPVVKEVFPKSGPFVLVAESFSTPLAAKLAAERPPNLLGLILCNGFHANPVGRWSVLARPLARALLLGFSPPRWALEHLLIGSRAPEAFARYFPRGATDCEPRGAGPVTSGRPRLRRQGSTITWLRRNAFHKYNASNRTPRYSDSRAPTFYFNASRGNRRPPSCGSFATWLRDRCR